MAEKPPNVDSVNTENDDQQEFELPVDERVDALEPVAHITHGYVDDHGQWNIEAPMEKVYEAASGAIVTRRNQRETVIITRGGMMKIVWPLVPGPGQWAEQEDPDAAAGLYKRLNTRLWRWLDPNSTGPIQSRLNGDQGLILCRSNVTPDHAWGVYCTRDWKCIEADYTGPDSHRIESAIRRMGKNVLMAADRTPEHAKKLRTTYTQTVDLALRSGVAPINRMIEAADEKPGNSDADAPEGDEE